MEINLEEKEKKINHLIQRDLRQEEINNNEKNKLNTNISKSNQNLVKVNYEKKYSLSLFSEKESKIKKRKLGKTLSIKIQKILDNSNKNNDIFETININSNNSDKDFKESFKTKIFRTIGKKVNNFSQSFEDKNKLLIELFKKFVSKMMEIHHKFGLFSNKNSNSMDFNSKIKNLNIKFINFNEVYIFERKIIEFIEKRIDFYNKIINSTDSLFFDNNNINLEILNKFYNELERDNINNINIKNKRNSLENKSEKYINSTPIIEDHFIESYDNKNNLLNKLNNADFGNILNIKKTILNTERNYHDKNNYKKLILPSLKNIVTSDNQLYSSSFRNSQKNQNSISSNKTNKIYEIFNKQKNRVVSPIKRENKNRILMSLQAMKSNDDKNKMVKIKLKDKDINNDDIIEKETNVKDIIEKEEEINENFNNNEVKKRRKSVVALTVPNYQNINNVNDYILNYDQFKEDNENKEDKKYKDNKEYKEDKDFKEDREYKKVKEKNEDKKLKQDKVDKIDKEDKGNKDNQLLDSISKFSKDHKQKIKLELSYDSDNEKKDSENKNIKTNQIEEIKRQDSNDKNKINNNDDTENFSSEKSFEESSIKKEDDSKDENKKKHKVSTKTISSIGSKDPLDDIKYLKRMREKERILRLKSIEYLFSDDEK